MATPPQIFVTRKDELVERRSFETDAAILTGSVVELNSDKEVAVATNTDKAIGIIDSMSDYRAENETGTIAAGDMATVALFGKSFKGKSGGTFACGSYLATASGVFTGTTTATKFIALEAVTTSGSYFEFLKK